MSTFSSTEITEASSTTFVGITGSIFNSSSLDESGSQEILQPYYMEILVDPDRRGEAYQYDPQTDTHQFKINYSDQKGPDNGLQLRSEYNYFTTHSFQVRFLKFNGVDGEFCQTFSQHDPPSIAAEYDLGLASGYRSQLANNIKYEGTKKFFSLKLRASNPDPNVVSDQVFILSSSLEMGEWFDVEYRYTWGANRNSTVIGKINNETVVQENVDTLWNQNETFYVLIGCYQDGDIGKKGIETITQVRNYKMGDSSGMFQVLPNYDKQISDKNNEPPNNISFPLDPRSSAQNVNGSNPY